MKERLKKQKKIKFSRTDTSHKNEAAELAIKMVVTMSRTFLIHAALRCPEDTFYTNLSLMAMYYALWIQNWIPDMQSGLSNIEILSRSSFEPVSETLINCGFWGCPTYILEPKLQKPGVKNSKWDPRSQK